MGGREQAGRQNLRKEALMSEQGEAIRVVLAEGVEMVFRHIPEGSFRMGQRGRDADEEPVTLIKVGEFWMGETPVTQEQYRVMAKGCEEELAAFEGNEGADPSRFKGDRNPVEQVNWHEARVVAKWLTLLMTKKAYLPTGYVVELPWETQWEYACRAKTEAEYHSGDGAAALEKAAWYSANANGQTHSVGEKEKNRWGLFDMHGNVWEWCRDCFDGHLNRLRLPGGIWQESPEGEGSRVLRGGSWGSTAGYCRSACRDRVGPGGRFRFGGFRLALVPGPGEEEVGDRESGAEPKAAAGKARDEPDQAEAVRVDGESNLPPRSGGEIFKERARQ